MRFKKEVMGKSTYLGILILFLAILLVSGCTTQKKETTTAVDNVYQGTQGVVISFLENSLPSKLYVTSGQTSLPVALKIENKGATLVHAGQLDIFFEGFDPNYIGGYSGLGGTGIHFNPDEDLEGKTRYNQYGGSTIKSISDYQTIIRLPPELNEYSPNFGVSWIYDYKTVASSTVCIDPKPYELSPIDKPCKVSDISFSGGQGAPVGVTKIVVTPIGSSSTNYGYTSGSKTNFMIYIRNLGTGTILNTHAPSPGAITQAMSNKIGALNMRKYTVTVGGSGSYGYSQITCQPEVLQFYSPGTDAILQCTFPTPYGINNAYETVIQVELEYSYYDSISKKIQLIRTDTGSSAAYNWDGTLGTDYYSSQPSGQYGGEIGR